MRKTKTRQNLIGWLFVLPSLLAFALFMFLPIVLGFWYSLTDYTGLSKDYHFIGIQNYIDLFDDRYFKVSIRNNVIYAVLFSVLTMLFALFLATLLNRLVRFRKFFRTVFFLPYISSMVSVAIIWKMIFNANGGPLNTILQQRYSGPSQMAGFHRMGALCCHYRFCLEILRILYADLFGRTAEHSRQSI